jgi:FHS family L-fucose permease-like MFS transporter
MDRQTDKAAPSAAADNGHYLWALAALAILFFMWGFCTVLNDTLVPHLKAVFQMSYFQAGFIQFVFFGAYFALAIPAAWLIERVGYKYAIVVGLAIMGVGCLVFLPASNAPSYALFLAALFVLASGITILQVAANPYVAVLGPERLASSRLNLTQALNSFGTFIGPYLGSVFILSRSKIDTAATGAVVSLQDRLADARAVQTPYLIIAAVLFAIAVVFSILRLPAIPTQPQTAAEAHDSIFRHRLLVLGIGAIFVYVGAEVSIGSYLASYISQPDIGQMTVAEAGKYVSFYWGGAMIGRLVGAFLMRFIRPSRILAFNALAAIALIVLSVATRGQTAMWAILAVGLCNSIMFPTIFTLGIRGLGALTGRGSGALIMAIVGGAVIPPLMGRIADSVGLALSFALPAVCYVYIWFFALQSASGERSPDAAPATA